MSTATTETVLITGASSGIGLELARCFAADKSNLIIVARTQAALEELARELRSQYKISVHVLCADLAKPESSAQVYSELKGRGLVVDVLVNNAGFGLHGGFTNLPLRSQLEMIQVNLTALVELTGLFLPEMVARNRGGILNVGSVAGFVPGPQMAVYYATKAFVRSFSEALHEELRGTNINVTNLCPGPTESNFSKVARSHHVREAQAKKMTAAEVALAGHADFRRGKAFSIPGMTNKLMSIAPSLLPKFAVRRMVGRYNKLK
jgi:short-subunit dehydrogenase